MRGRRKCKRSRSLYAYIFDIVLRIRLAMFCTNIPESPKSANVNDVVRKFPLSSLSSRKALCASGYNNNKMGVHFYHRS